MYYNFYTASWSQQTEIIHNDQTEFHRDVFKEKDYLFYKATPDKIK